MNMNPSLYGQRSLRYLTADFQRLNNAKNSIRKNLCLKIKSSMKDAYGERVSEVDSLVKFVSKNSLSLYS